MGGADGATLARLSQSLVCLRNRKSCIGTRIMATSHLLLRLSRLTPCRMALLAEAFLMLGLASAAIRLLPFRRVAQAASVGRRNPYGGEQAQTIEQVRRAVQGWASRVPWRAVCIQNGLAVHLMLRRRGVASVLHYGVAQRRVDGIAAHVWVSVGARDVIGGNEAHRFTCLASFPTLES